MRADNTSVPTFVGLRWDGPGAGGAGRYLRDLHSALGGTSPVVTTEADPDDPPFVFTPTRRLRGTARELSEATLVDAHAPLPVSLWSADPRRRGIPLVFHFHGPWADEAAYERSDGSVRYVGRRAVERLVARRADAIVCLSRAFAAKITADHGVDNAKVNVIPPMVDGTHFTPGDKSEARRMLGLDSARPTVACVRRLVARTAVEDLIVAASETPDPPKLVIVGDGPRRAALESLAQGRGVDAWFTGHLSEQGVLNVYRAADLSVVPSRALEGFGLATLESLACGTAVIVTDTGGAPEAIDELDRTLVVPHSNPSALADRIQRALGGEVPSGEACRDHALTFSESAFRDAHLAVYNKVAR